MRILVVEDNGKFGQLLTEQVAKAGFSTELATSAETFRNCIAMQDYDLFLIDLSLPDDDGLNLIRELRAGANPTPVIVMTARAAVCDRIAGLDLGADDYLPKPFNHKELMARIRAVLRRSPVPTPETLRVGQLELHIASGDILCGEQRIELRPSEQRLLALLLRRAGRLVARSAIEGALQGLGDERSANAVDKLVSRLRQALSSSPSGLELKTVRGAGYVLEEKR